MQIRAGDRVRIGLSVLELRDQRRGGGPALGGPASSRPSPPPAPRAWAWPSARDTAAVGDDYAALAALVDTNVKRQTGVAVFAMLAAAGLAVLIYFGVT